MGGCVGHYLFDELIKRDDLDLTFLIRSPQKVKYDLSKVNLIKDELKNIKKYSSLIKEMDYIVHLLPDWGGEEGNFQETKEFFDCIDLNRTGKILYFSTASILGPENKAAREALACGTPYIRGKYKMHEELKTMPHLNKTVTLFPTWVLGGDEKHPYSHAYFAVKQAAAWIRLVKLFNIDITFHFIHARDVALSAMQILGSDIQSGEYVLGNPPVTFNGFIKAICAHLGIKDSRYKIKVPVNFIGKISSLSGRNLSAWDNYCIDNRNTTYNVSNPLTFGIQPEFDTAEKVLKEIFP